MSSDIRGRLGLGGALVRRAMADVLGKVWGGAVHLLHGRIEWASKQLFTTTSDDDAMLEEAAMYGIYPSPAEYASGSVTATGTNGSTIAEDEILVRSDGATYRVTALATIASGTATVGVQAVDAGSAGNLEAGEELAFESPVPGVDSSVLVAGPGGLAGGFEQEEPDGTRDRLLLLKREKPTGGSDQDYEAWALAVAGVTRAWVYRHENGLGTVVVRFVLDEEEDIFPDSPTVASVQAAINAERPTTAEVTVAAPTPLPVDFGITLNPDTADIRTAVQAELTDLLFRKAEPGDGAGRGTVLLSHLLVAIGVAVGEGDFTLASPAADVVPATGELAVMGTIDWSP